MVPVNLPQIHEPAHLLTESHTAPPVYLHQVVPQPYSFLCSHILPWGAHLRLPNHGREMLGDQESHSIFMAFHYCSIDINKLSSDIKITLSSGTSVPLGVASRDAKK